MGKAGAQGLRGGPTALQSQQSWVSKTTGEKWGEAQGLSLDSDLTGRRLEASPELTPSSDQHCPENVPAGRGHGARAALWCCSFGPEPAARSHLSVPHASSPLPCAILRNRLPRSAASPDAGPTLCQPTPWACPEGGGVWRQEAVRPSPGTQV